MKLMDILSSHMYVNHTQDIYFMVFSIIATRLLAGQNYNFTLPNISVRKKRPFCLPRLTKTEPSSPPTRQSARTMKTDSLVPSVSKRNRCQDSAIGTHRANEPSRRGCQGHHKGASHRTLWAPTRGDAAISFAVRGRGRRGGPITLRVFGVKLVGQGNAAGAVDEWIYSPGLVKTDEHDEVLS